MTPKELQQKVREHLQAKKAKLPACPLCTKADWGAGELVGMIAAPAGAGQVFQSANFVPIICRHCGYTMLLQATG
jgi:predicted nucleic-acid-binding Zn-ribbon protein